MSVPKLRFKEFKEEWKLIKLGKIADKITSGARDWAQYYLENGSKFIRMTNLSREGIHLKLDDLKFVNVKAESSDGQRTSLIHGDILISITAELGKIGWIPPNFGEAFINQHTGLVRLKKEQADSLFIAYLLSTAKLNKQINRLNDSGAKSGLNLPTIASINIHLPKISEQNKIADFLVTIDKKIAQLKQKYELLARYKKGVMQQIFSQELRFKDDDGRDFPDWEDKKLQDVTKINQGLQIVISERYTEKVKDSYFYITNEFLKENSQRKYFIKNPSESVLCDEDDILMTRTGNTGQVVTNVSGAFHNNFFKIKYDHKKVAKWFLFYFLTSYKIQCSILRLAGTSTIPDLNHGDFYNIDIFLPPISEQIKVAKFLTSIDEKITEAQTYLDTVKQYKQGLLQQMFV